MPSSKQQRVTVSSSSKNSPATASNYLGTAYRELTAPENQSVVKSIAVFGVSCHCCEQLSG